MKANLKEKNLIAKNTLKLIFSLEKKINFKAGQYAFITLTGHKIDEPRGNKHHFSIVNPPEENDKITFITRLTGSKFKNTLKSLTKNEEVEIRPIGGEFTLPKKAEQPLVFIAGGIGITPFISMIDHIKRNDLEHKITLVYSNHDKQSTVYFEKLQSWQKEMDNLDIIFTMTSSDSWNGETRIIDNEFIKDYFNNLNNYHFMIAGPPKMVEAVGEEIKKTGVNKNRVKSESFSGYE